MLDRNDEMVVDTCHLSYNICPLTMSIDNENLSESSVYFVMRCFPEFNP